MSNGNLPRDDNGVPALGAMNDATGQILPLHVGAIVIGADGKSYAKVDTTITSPVSATAAITSVAASITSEVLLVANSARKGSYFFNESTAIMYLALAATATILAYTVQVPANSFYELPTTPVYTGAISAIWSAANGSARITEMS